MPDVLATIVPLRGAVYWYQSVCVLALTLHVGTGSVASAVAAVAFTVLTNGLTVTTIAPLQALFAGGVGTTRVVGVRVGVRVRVGVSVRVGVRVRVAVGRGVAVRVQVRVGVAVGTATRVGVRVGGGNVHVAVGVLVRTGVRVAVGAAGPVCG